MLIDLYITNLHFSDVGFLFIAYSMLGWACESFIVSLIEKKWINRGFLFGPFEPSTGIGMLLILAFFYNINANPLLIFFVSAILGTVIEFITVFLSEYLFSAKWWGNGSKKLYFIGKAGLINFLLFGFLGTFSLYFINPLLESAIRWFYPDSLRVLVSLLLALMILDMVLSLASFIDIKKRMDSLKKIELKLEKLNEKYEFFDNDNFVLDDLELCMKRYSDNEEIYYILSDLKNILDIKTRSGRILNAFPRYVPIGYAKEYKFLRTGKDKVLKAINNFINKHEPDKTENENPDKILRLSLRESLKKSYQNITVTRLIWVFFIGCLVGYILETMYCILHNGFIESRQGMIYGPFSQVYGLGAVTMVVLLDPISNKKIIWLFLFSGLIGGLFEAGANYMQEILFNTTSWNYSYSPLSIFGGRTSAEYMLFWGAMGTIYIRLIYPKIIDLVDSIPKRPRRVFTIAITLVLSADLLISGFAVERWSERQQDIPATNVFEQFIDDHYNDKYMRHVYPHMKIS